MNGIPLINNNPPSIKNPLLIFWRIFRIIKTPLNFFGAQIFRIIKTPLIGAKRRRKFWGIFGTKNGFLKGEIEKLGVFLCSRK